MPLREMRVTGYRPFADSGLVRIAPCGAIVGRNDVGKSGLLAALKTFFVPPKKGLPLSDIHLCDPDSTATIEVAFDPNSLSSRTIQNGKKGQLDVVTDGLTDKKGFLRLRMTVSTKRVDAFEICVYDFADNALAPLALKSEDQLSELLKASEDAPRSRVAVGRQLVRRDRHRIVT